MYFQLLNSQTRVKHFTEAVSYSDSGLRATAAIVKNDDVHGGNPSDFEPTSKRFIPHDPVAKRKSRKDHDGKHASTAKIYAALSSMLASNKPSTRKTRVRLRWHATWEFNKFKKKQRN